MTASVNPLLFTTATTADTGKASSSAASTAFSALLSSELSSQLSELAFGGMGDSEAATSVEGAAMLAQVPMLLNGLEEGGDLKTAVMLFFMMMGTGASASSMGAAMASLSAALSGSSSDTLESIRFDVLNELVSSGYDRTGLQRANDMVFSNSTNEALTPFSASKPANPTITSQEGARSPELYRSVIDQFQVETNPRYAVNKKGNNDTYCNIFLWDVTSAMGAEIPHYVDPVTLEARSYTDKGAKELNANGIYDWLGKKGADYGWVQVTPEQAQQYANQGFPVVTAWKNPQGHGHVQVVCPSNDGRYDPSRGVTIAQAGRTLTSYKPITDVYNESLKNVVYYAHA